MDENVRTWPKERTARSSEPLYKNHEPRLRATTASETYKHRQKKSRHIPLTQQPTNQPTKQLTPNPTPIQTPTPPPQTAPSPSIIHEYSLFVHCLSPYFLAFSPAAPTFLPRRFCTRIFGTFQVW